jgi:sigma-70, region 4
MATIKYTFADGHTEEVEVTEEFKREYEFLLVREQAPHWKEMKQKERAGLRCVKNLSLDKFSEDGYDLPADSPDPLERLIQKEERREYYRKILSCLTEKQRQAYILFHLKGYKKVQIAAILHIDERSVRRRLEWAQKRILKIFSKNSRF